LPVSRLLTIPGLRR